MMAEQMTKPSMDDQPRCSSTLPPPSREKGVKAATFFNRRTSTGSGLFALFSRDFEQILWQNLSLRVKTLSHSSLVASRDIKREKHSLPVDLRRSKTSLIKLPKTREDGGTGYSAQFISRF